MSRVENCSSWGELPESKFFKSNSSWRLSIEIGIPRNSLETACFVVVVVVRDPAVPVYT